MEGWGHWPGRGGGGGTDQEGEGRVGALARKGEGRVEGWKAREAQALTT